MLSNTNEIKVSGFSLHEIFLYPLEGFWTWSSIENWLSQFVLVEFGGGTIIRQFTAHMERISFACHSSEGLVCGEAMMYRLVIDAGGY